MARVAKAVTCSDEERAELEQLSRSRSRQARLVERATMIVGCLAGQRNDQIAARMKVQPATVAVWRKRFMTNGLAGLHDKARSGKPPTYVASALRERILRQLELPAPEGQSGWDGATLAQER